MTNVLSSHPFSLQDLCAAALQFASDTLRPGGHFVCKFYQGSEDKALEQKVKALFHKVYREKPDSSRSVSASRPGYSLGKESVYSQPTSRKAKSRIS
jgi:21S rRNA (uridine2791-2'-O)-methyltransferase